MLLEKIKTPSKSLNSLGVSQGRLHTRSSRVNNPLSLFLYPLMSFAEGVTNSVLQAIGFSKVLDKAFP
jgi:hypothetical protein